MDTGNQPRGTGADNITSPDELPDEPAKSLIDRIGTHWATMQQAVLDWFQPIFDRLRTMGIRLWRSSLPFRREFRYVWRELRRWYSVWRGILRGKVGRSPRALTLAVTFVATIVLVVQLDGMIDGGTVYRRVFLPVPADLKTGPEWQHLIQALTVLVGLPVAYLLWHWRDANVRAGIENQRKDTNLQEFQEVQLRAAGALSKDFDVVSRTTLQIAALHQLRGYLRGEYGQSFTRPAFELYCAVLEHEKIENDQGSGAVAATGIEASVYRTIRSVISEEWLYFFRSGFPLRGRTLRNIHLNSADLSSLDLSECDFSGSVFTGCDFSGSTMNEAEFRKCRFMHCDATEAFMVNSVMQGCTFKNSNLSFATCRRMTIEHCVFVKTSMLKSDFSHSTLDHVDFSRCFVVQANFADVTAADVDITGALYDHKTTLFDPRSPGERELGAKKLEDSWLRAGAIDVTSPDTIGRQLAAWGRSVGLVQNDDSLVSWIPDYLVLGGAARV